MANGGVAFAADRQHMLYTPSHISKAKQRLKNDTTYQRAWGTMRSEAQDAARRKDIRRLGHVAMAWLITDSTYYYDAIRETLLKLKDTQTWGSTEMLARKPVWRADLGLAGRTYQTAIAYDAIRDRLSPGDRKTISESLYRLALEPSLGDWIIEPTRIHSLNSMGHNWWTSCACMGGIMALSLRDDIKEAKQWARLVEESVPLWFGFAGDVLQHKPKSFDAAGGMYESVNYANFGISEALLFRIAYRNVFGEKSLSPIPELEAIPTFFINVCYPHTDYMESLNFGDSHQNIVATNTMVTLWELGQKDPDILWYLSRVKQNQDRDGYYLNSPLGFLFWPDTSKAPAKPSRHLSQMFSDFGWATMRTSWAVDPTMLAVKCGYTWNHSHADATSFSLWHKGIDILKDGGHCWYPNEYYRKYFFQSQSHNVVLFNGEGQPTEQQYQGSPLRGYLYYLMDNGLDGNNSSVSSGQTRQHPSMKYILADGTGPYSKNFSRQFRHFLWIDNVIYIIDDLKTHEQGEFQWLWHYRGEMKKHNSDFTFTEGNSSVVLRPLYPRLAALSNFVHDYPEDLYWEQPEVPTEDLKATEHYLSLHLPGKFDRIKAVNAVILKDSPDLKQLPMMERREGKEWIGLRITNDDRITDIYINQLADGRLMHNNSWIECDGFETDAYMFAVTYKKGEKPQDSHDRFICYGSALRHSGKSLFASQAKLFVMQTGNDIRIEGQPHGIAYIGDKRIKF
ncbi:MAG: heparinase II/III family protein [Prevotella sp.]